MIGGSIGSFLGPWGALAGAAVGHVLVDRKGAPSERDPLRLLAVTAGALYELAGVDGRYTSKEDKAARAILGELNLRLGTRLSAQDLAFLIDDSARIDRSLARLAALARGNPELARAATAWLWRTAVSDCDAVPAETECIRSFACHAGLPEEDALHVSLLYVRFASSPSDKQRREACHVLGVPYHADAASVKSAYRTLSQKYHPDKHADLDPDIRALTAEKFGQIKAAYDTLADERSRTGDWFAKQAAGGNLVPAVAGALVSCFVCGVKHRLPDAAEHLESARCTACQSLLSFERPLAEQLA